MNLVKLFNLKYFIQNIKKSKMAIILFLSVVPIFTSLLIITSASNSYVSSFIELASPNIIFMYITPFILSFSLFGYVYKKRSIDFIGSMPISRKSVFATNTLGGIILIIIMQLITLLCTLIFGAVTDSLIFTKMVWDIFLYQTVAYIFVFVVANLAVTVSGNVITQIVVTLLILFVISASVLYVNAWNNPKVQLIDDGYDISTNYRINTEFNYTAPSLLFNDGNYIFNGVSLFKMIVLSVGYIILGYFLFKNKKMEYAGESFENKFVHFLVKGLTLIPFVMILVALVDSDEWEAIMILMAIVCVYYLVYDLITNKKNKLRENLVALIVSIAVLFGVYGILINVTENIKFRIDLEDIKSFNIKEIGGNDFWLETEIKDISLIEDMIYNGNKIKYDYIDSESVKLELRLKNGITKSLTIYNVPVKTLETVLRDFENLKISKKAKISIGYSEIELTDKERETIQKELEEVIKNKNPYEIYLVNRNEASTESLIIYDYKNHDLVKLKCSIKISDKIFDIVTSAYNKESIKTLERKLKRGEYISLNIIDAEKLKPYMPEDYNQYISYYGEIPEEITNFILENKDEKANMQEYICMNISGERFYTSNLKGLADILKKYYKDTDEYRYYKDVELYEPINTEEITIEYIPNTEVID